MSIMPDTWSRDLASFEVMVGAAWRRGVSRQRL